MRIGVYGIGNVLRQDDGFGPSAVDRLAREWDLSDDVVVRDLGTPGLDLASHLVGLDAVILFDAIEMGGTAGDLHVFDEEEITARAPQGWRTSTHQAGLREALWTARALGEGPARVRLVGVVPEHLATGAGLGEAVREALPRALEIALAQLRHWGVVPRRAREGRPASAWWETAALG